MRLNHLEYFPQTGTLSLYFVKIKRNTIAFSDEVWPGILVDYSQEEGIVAMDIASANTRTTCNFPQDGKPESEYDASRQVLTLTFGNLTGLEPTVTDDRRVTIWKTTWGLIAKIEIKDSEILNVCR